MQFSIFVTGKMAPLTGAQRQKRYREQLRRENPYINTRLKQLAKVRQYQKIQQVSYKALNDDEKEKLRKKWRNAKQGG